MTFLDLLATAEQQNQSMLCVGLDPEPGKFPGALGADDMAVVEDGVRRVHGL